MGISSRLCLSREGWKMSSCCLAACGRLAENSQSGEAGFNSLWTGSPGTSAPRVAAAACRAPPLARGRGLAGEGGCGLPAVGIFLSSASPCQVCPMKRRCAASPPFALPKPFHPPTSALPAAPAPAAPSCWIGGCGMGPTTLPALPLLWFSPSPCCGHADYFQPRPK